MNIFYQNKLKPISCRRLETKSRSVRNGDFGFRRKAQVRTNLPFTCTTYPGSPQKIISRQSAQKKCGYFYALFLITEVLRH